MAIKGQGITVTYLAWNTANQAGQANDAANHTIGLYRDGVLAAPDNAPADTTLAGLCTLAITAAEMDADAVTVAGTSATADVVIIPVQIVTEAGAIASLEDHGDATWITAATGGLATSDEIAALGTHGDLAWITADVSELATGQQIVDLRTHGDGAWATAATGNLALSADVQALLARLTAARASRLDLIGTATMVVAGPATASGDYRIFGGSDYKAADGRAIRAVSENYAGPDLTGAALTLRLLDAISYFEQATVAADLEVPATTFVNDEGARVFSADLAAAQTAALSPSPPAAHRNYVGQFVASLANGDVAVVGEIRITARKGILAQGAGEAG